MKLLEKKMCEVATLLQTDFEAGLTDNEAAVRLQKNGLNALPESKHRPLYAIFASQFQNPLIYILLIAAGIIFFFDPLDACIISGVLFFNAIIGTIQEGRASHILESLRHLITSDAIVIRNSKRTIVPDYKIVVGDIIILQEGEKVCADAQLIEANNLLVSQANLTGESAGIYKSADALPQSVPLQYQKNVVFRGTYILSGSGKAVVTATGAQTEIGKLGRTLEEISTDTPLKQEIDRLSHWILLFILSMCIFLFFFGLATGSSFTELLVILTALFICVIPEGLPLVLTLTLVTGAFRMAKKNVLIKKLQAVEGLGRANIIIIDKTGTLTRNELIVSDVYANNTEYHATGQGYHTTGAILYDNKPLSDNQLKQLEPLATACMLTNHSQLEYIKELDIFHMKGDPLEAALGIFADKCGITEAHRNEYTLIRSLPFDPTKRYQAVVYEKNNTIEVYIVGAPEVIFESISPTTQDTAALENLLNKGFRVIAVGSKTISLTRDQVSTLNYTKLEELCKSGITLLGLLGIQDTIRTDVARTIERARAAGMHIVMATGDHEETALFVAERVGIYKEGDALLDGQEIDMMTDAELQHTIRNTTVFSRVSPEHKMRIVRAFQANNNTVAMTGDGVNDAPSLMAADLGIAMGSIGTEVAKQAADMVLLDDSLASIIEAIKEGRHIFYTIKRTVLYFFTTNLAEVLIVLYALLARLPLPITAAQILWLNLITDGFLDAALAMENQEKGLLEKKIYTNSHIVDRPMLIKVLYMSAPMALGSLYLFYSYYTINIREARTLVVVTMALFQWFNAWNCRSETQSVFQLGLFSNRWLIAATAVVCILQLLLLYNPYLQIIFDTTPLTIMQLGTSIMIASSLFFVEELRKLFMYWYTKD